jgi:hypothetical protein
MVISTGSDGADGSDGDQVDSLELITGAGTEEVDDPDDSTDGTGPERHTLILGDPIPEAPLENDSPRASLVPHDDLYLGDGDEIDLIDGVDPDPVFRPALIDSDDEGIMVDPPGPDAEPDVVEVEDTLMAGDDYGDVP